MHSLILGIKEFGNRLDRLNVFKKKSVDRQAPLLLSPLAAFVGLVTGVAAVGVAEQTGIIDTVVEGVVEAANETYYETFGGMIYWH